MTESATLTEVNPIVILAFVVFTQCQRVTVGRTDGQTDRQTDIPIVTSTGLAATADALFLSGS